jgi:CPA2 family monovalent cation:H+ antiporter-2
VILTLPEIDSARLAVRAVRSINAEVPVLARAHRRAEAEALGTAPGVEVIQPELEAAAAAIRRALVHLRVPEERLQAYLERFRGAMEAGARDPRQRPDLPDVKEVTLPDGRIAGQSLRDARIRERFGVSVVAVARSEGVILNPPPDTILRAGDKLRLFGLPAQVDAFVAAAQTTD